MTTTELSKTATNYITAIVKGEEPPVKGAVATSILRKLTKEGYVTEKGRPTKKAKLLVTHLLEPLDIDAAVMAEVDRANSRIAAKAKTKKPAKPVAPEGSLPIHYDEKLIGWLTPEETVGDIVIYDCYLLVDGTPKNQGFSMSKEAAFAKLRKAFRQLS